MATIMQRSFRRKPARVMDDETGADTGGGELPQVHRAVPADDDRCRARPSAPASSS